MNSWNEILVKDYNNANIWFGNRGVIGGSYTNSCVMDYVTISTTGNATTFGTMSMNGYHSSCSNGTRGLMAGGGGTGSNIIEYLTFSSIGNAIDFGDLTVGRWGLTGCSIICYWMRCYGNN